MVFNVLVGNSDDHLRNHGVIYDGGWHLSPLYEVVPTPQLGTDRFLVLALGVEGKRATLINVLSGHAAFGLAKENAAHEIEALRLRVADGWPIAVAKSGLNVADCVRLARCFAASDNAEWMSCAV